MNIIKNYLTKYLNFRSICNDLWGDYAIDWGNEAECNDHLRVKFVTCGSKHKLAVLKGYLQSRSGRLFKLLG